MNHARRHDRREKHKKPAQVDARRALMLRCLSAEVPAAHLGRRLDGSPEPVEAFRLHPIVQLLLYHLQPVVARTAMVLKTTDLTMVAGNSELPKRTYPKTLPKVAACPG